MIDFFRSPTFLFFAGIVGLVAIVVVAIQPRRDIGRGPMTSVERAQQLAKEGKREQIITFSSGLVPLRERAVDELHLATNLYAVGVGQITLGEPESIRRIRGSSFSEYSRVLGAGGNTYLVGDDESQTVFGPFNNIMIFDKRSGTLEKIFGERISITGFKWMNRVNPRSIAIMATGNDSNRDGKLNGNDIQELFVYVLDQRRLHRVTGLAASVDDVANIPDVDYLIVEASVDTNKDGEIAEVDYDRKKVPEPQALFRVDLRTFAAAPLVNDALAADLQATLDGVKGVPRTN